MLGRRTETARRYELTEGTAKQPAEGTGKQPADGTAAPQAVIAHAEPPPPSQDAAMMRAAGPERVTWIDWAIVALAVVSLLLVIAEEVLPSYLRARPEVLRWFIIADLVICGVFALEFLLRMRHQPSKWAYAKSRWYDILGMIPVSHPLFRGFRLVRILRIVVITSRFVRATNRTFGEMVFEATVSRFRNVLVDVVGGAITLRSIGMVEPWLVQARFAERIGDAMEHRRADIHRMVQDAIGKLPGSRVLSIRPMRGMMQNAEAAAVQAVIDTLRSDELNRLVQQSTKNIIDELRQQIAREEGGARPGASQDAGLGTGGSPGGLSGSPGTSGTRGSSGV